MARSKRGPLGRFFHWLLDTKLLLLILLLVIGFFFINHYYNKAETDRDELSGNNNNGTTVVQGEEDEGVNEQPAVATKKISGVLYDFKGLPLVNTKVIIQREDDSTEIAYSNEEGSFYVDLTGTGSERIDVKVDHGAYTPDGISVQVDFTDPDESIVNINTYLQTARIGEAEKQPNLASNSGGETTNKTDTRPETSPKSETKSAETSKTTADTGNKTSTTRADEQKGRRPDSNPEGRTDIAQTQGGSTSRATQQKSRRPDTSPEEPETLANRSTDAQGTTKDVADVQKGRRPDTYSYTMEQTPIKTMQSGFRYLIAGSYSSKQNAYNAGKASGENFEIYSRDGKYYLSLYKSTSSTDIAKQKKSLIARYPKIWTASKKYYLIVGSFLNKESAVKKSKELGGTVVTNKDKYLVSVYSNAKRSEVQYKQKTLADKYPSAWIF